MKPLAFDRDAVSMVLDFTGSAHVRTSPFKAGRLVRCAKCGQYRAAGGGPHSPHFNSKQQLVDCEGEPVK